jgi:hypothetical protein
MEWVIALKIEFDQKFFYSLFYWFKGTQDYKTYQWHFGNVTTGPKIGPDGSSGYLIALRLNPSAMAGRADVFSPQIQGAASGQLICNSF